MIDAVLSYHMNPQTCGVAKFNHELARRLGVDILPLSCYEDGRCLISVKLAETPPAAFGDLGTDYYYDLFLHDWSDSDIAVSLIGAANKVYAANKEIARRVREYRPVIEAFCPSTIHGNPHRGAYRVLVFGMAHKLNLPHFEKLKAQLDAEHPDYTIELSTAVHEGNPWDAALTQSVENLRRIFGVRLRVLGYLGDDALARLLQECDACALYYVPALRANNTTYWAAVEAGKTIYTNRDEHSPQAGDPPASWDKLIEVIRG